MKNYVKRIRKYWQIYILMSGGILFFLYFKVLPVWGLGTAFVDYNIKKGIPGSEFVGFKNFTDFFAGPNFWKIMRNTLAISFMNLFLAFPAPIILSLLLNEVRHSRFKSINQSIIYMPHFMSWAVIASLTFFIFSTDVGVVNKFLVSTGHEAVPFLTNQDTFWWFLLLQTVWKEIGWGTIVYLAAISQVDQSLYEAVYVDGANRFQRMWHVTVPCIIPTLVVMFLMQLGKMMNVSFEQVWMMSNSMVSDVAETFETYSFRVGVLMGNYSIGSAVGLFKSAIALALVIISNWIIKKTGNEGIY